MQVSSVCASVFSAIETAEIIKTENTGIVNDSSLNAFTSKNSDLNIDMNSIYEWKVFSQNQIIAHNLDYIA